MTGAELQQAGVRLFGERGWQVALASRLKVDRSTVWRFVNSEEVPGPVEAAVSCWLKHGAPE